MGVAKENASSERYRKQIPFAYWSPRARIVYDGTVRFWDCFLGKRDRTVDQMVQAARSGKQGYKPQHPSRPTNRPKAYQQA